MKELYFNLWKCLEVLDECGGDEFIDSKLTDIMDDVWYRLSEEQRTSAVTQINEYVLQTQKEPL